MFYEEARELLIGLEEGLMELERRQSDRAHLDRTFRAAHSLKGAAAMVGLPAIAEFTHFIEAVLERVRAGLLTVDSDIITTLLEARDHLAAMVESEAAGAPIPPSGELAQRLRGLVPGPAQARGGGSRGPGIVARSAPAGRPAAEAPVVARIDNPPSVVEATLAPGVSEAVAPKPKAPARKTRAAATPKAKPKRPPRTTRRTARKMPPAAADPDSASHRDATPGDEAAAYQATLAPPSGAGGNGAGETVYVITLVPGPEVLRRGINPLGVLDELRELGEAEVTTDSEHVPPLDQLDPERCYLSWTIRLKTDAGPARLEEAFLFFAEDSTVTIEQEMRDGTRVAPERLAAAAGPKELPHETPPALAAPAAADLAAVAAQPAVAQAVPAPVGPEAPAPEAPTGAPPVAAAAARPASATPPSGAPALVARTGAIPRPHSRIRVDALQLDDLVGLAGELAVVSDNLIGLREIPGAAPWSHALEALQRVARQIRDTTLELRMVPVDELFSRFPRQVRDLADRSGKEIELRVLGQETRLDRTIVERLGDPMVHLIRNAVDHALESPQDRVAKGKPRVGRITLAAGHEGDRVAIRVEDDGRGLDREKIVRKGVALGMVPAGTSIDDPRVVDLIFRPGFSTRENVSELSGRGVGLDVVRDAVRALRGSVAVESTPGKGTAFVFRLPLTLALIDGLLVETAGGRYVVPLAQVEECVALNGTRAALAEERPCVAVRGELVPMVSLRSVFRANGPMPARQELLLTRHGGQRVGVAVDRLLGRVQAVIQSLGEGLHSLARFSGATILGDGSVSLILDLSALVSESRFAESSARNTA
jgi:two-component system chemotaxis sensor kinase CheA